MKVPALLLLAQAAGACHLPDNTSFIDEDGWSCAHWDEFLGARFQAGNARGHVDDCYEGFHKWKYSPDGAIAVLQNCMRACRVCYGTTYSKLTASSAAVFPAAEHQAVPVMSIAIVLTAAIAYAVRATRWPSNRLLL